MKTKSTILFMVAALLLSNYSLAQSEEEGKIKIEITKEINGEKKTFKGTYNSTEEMRADPQYQEFAGEDQGVNFWFHGDDDDADISIHLDQLKNHSGSAFKFFHSDDDDEQGGNRFFYKYFDSDNDDASFNFDLDEMDVEELKEKLEGLGIEMEMFFNKFHDSDDKSHVRVFAFKQIKITDVDGEFGKKGKVDDSNVLELEDLTFFPNPAPNGQFKVRFNLPEEGELRIKVSNLEGKEVFSRYFERFGGTYSEQIDLSDQKDGIYLLEIAQGKKRITRKIVIN